MKENTEGRAREDIEKAIKTIIDIRKDKEEVKSVQTIRQRRE